VNQSTMSLEK